MRYNVYVACSLLSYLRTCVAFSSTPATLPLSSSANVKKVFDEFDYKNNDRLPWTNGEYNSWEWNGHKINYLEMGDKSKPALLLIHGFGASSYHWRHNIPVLARDYHVYAFDLLGFGFSDKPLVDYSAEVWRDQAIDFIKEMIQKPTTLAGNSLGGFTALYASSSDTLKQESLVNGCILLNAAGRFRDPNAPLAPEKENKFFSAIRKIIQRLVIRGSFVYAKQPVRIEQILKQVYPVKQNNVDSDLVESIQIPSTDPNAPEVFYRVITKNGSGPQRFVDDLLDDLECPLLLCWGEFDPWIRPVAADKIQAMYAEKSKRVSINAGHCPHDEDPHAVNSAISHFMKEIL